MPAIRVVNVTKRFGATLANDRVSINVTAGSWHAVVGENGAGKSTLLGILYGFHRPDSGTVFVDGRDVTMSMRRPADAIVRGIALVTQQYSLVPGLTALENVVLGQEPVGVGGRIDWRTATERARECAVIVDLPDKSLSSPIENLSPAAQQKTEIAKALFRRARILLLDEPTASLAPQEADSLFAMLHQLKESGTTIVAVTHKLQEVFEHSDRLTVMRAGRVAGAFDTRDVDRDIVFACMIGGTSEMRPVDSLDGSFSVPFPFGGEPERAGVGSAPAAIRLVDVSVAPQRGSVPVLQAGFEARAGEILGFAGVDGSGQTELAEVIVGLRALKSGRIEVAGRDVTHLDVQRRSLAGVGYIPADRNRDGLIPSFDIAQNVLLGHEADPDWGGGAWRIRRGRMDSVSEVLIADRDVRGADRGARTVVAALSGGNQQKVLLGRALRSRPRVLVACQPTRGLDILATRSVYDAFRQEAGRGTAILLFSLDLEEILALSDRVIVMLSGRLSPALEIRHVDRDRIGRMMTGLTPFDEPGRPPAEDG
ncbi:MAG: ABC transporter ATP-binding protein [Capsulimonadaceae bacterium]